MREKDGMKGGKKNSSGSCKRKCSSTSTELSAFRTKESLRELGRITRKIYMHSIFLQKMSEKILKIFCLVQNGFEKVLWQLSERA